MENIYKIRVRTNPDPRDLYPSERRYSASTVLGLGVVHLALAATALLLGSLSATVYQNQYSSNNTNLVPETMKTNFAEQPRTIPSTGNNNNNNSQTLEQLPGAETMQTEENSTSKTVRRREASDAILEKKIAGDDEKSKEFNPCTNLAIAPSVMTIGALAAGLSGLLAWKRWYIDHNIRWFFCMSIVSTVTSAASFVITTITIVLVNEHNETSFTDSILNISNSKASTDNANSIPGREMVLAYNILIASVLELMWSILSTKIGWIGMRANYPEDIINRSRGKIEVNTIHKGNKKGKIIPPDIISHFPVSGKIAKYFPKKESGYLPKAESNSEYMDRVKKFLSSNPESIK